MRTLLKSLILVFCGVWFLGLLFFVAKIASYTRYNQEVADAAIVLTGGDKRIEEGVRVLQQKLVSRVFITGVDTKVRHKKEIPFIDELYKIDNIEIGKEATTTKGNALEAKEWIEKNHIKTIKIITANYHMPRSILEFQYHIPGVKVEAYPVFPDRFDIYKWWYDKNSLILVLKEYTKYIYVLCYIEISGLI